MSQVQGTRLGAYELMECVGEGGMAEVYRARQLSAFGREVALKVIRREFTGDEAFRRRFLREAQAISRLSHPHILPLIEFGDERGLLYLVMPLVREGTLRDLLASHPGPLSIEEARPLFVPLCDAVQYVHQEDIIHRDIKPQNVLLQRYTHVLLADFGIARDRFDTHLTTTGVGMGSVEYMAPEQAEGRGDARSDIYSLGTVLYQMLTGVMPYSGTMPLEVLLKKTSEPPPDPRNFNPQLSAEAADILRVVLAKDPNQRFESAGALGQAVQQVRPQAQPAPLPGQMIWQPSPQAPEPPESDFAPTVRRRAPRWSLDEQETRRSQDFGTLPTTPSSSITSASTYQFDTAQPSDEERAPEEEDAARPARRRHMLLIAALVLALLLALGVSTIAYGHLGLPWLNPGAANSGAQLLTPTPGATAQPTPTPAPVHTASPSGGGKPTASTPTPQPTAKPTPTPGSTATPTPQPTATPTPGPTDTPTPQPTPTSTPGPTDTPTPQPAATPTSPPAAAPTAAPPSNQPPPAPTTPPPGNQPPPASTTPPEIQPTPTPAPTSPPDIQPTPTPTAPPAAQPTPAPTTPPANQPPPATQPTPGA